MHFDWWTLGLQTVNFAVLVWLLHQFLYQPILRMIDARKAAIRKQFDDAKSAEDKAKGELAGIGAERAGMASERDALLKAAAEQAQQAAEARRAQADREAGALLEATRKSLAVEREHAMAGLQISALDLGADYARQLLAGIPSHLRAESWIEQIDAHLQSLPVDERDALARQFTDGNLLTVVTATTLTPETMEAWRKRLQGSLGEGIAMTFKVDADLVAGAELHFPTAILRFSWRSALATLRSELGADGDPR